MHRLIAGVLESASRTAPGGQEQYWGIVVDQAGLPRPCHEEVRQICHDFASVGSLLAGTEPAADLAILNSYDDRWAIHIHRHQEDFDYLEHLLHYYRPLAGRNIATNIISVDASLDSYKLVIAPTLHLLNEERVSKLLAFVGRGGHLVLTIRSGVKDDLNALLPSRPLTEAAGVEVEDYYARVDTVPVSGTLFIGTSSIWSERPKVQDEVGTEIVARFGPSNGWLDHQPAVTAHPGGVGKVNESAPGLTMTHNTHCSTGSCWKRMDGQGKGGLYRREP